MPNVRCPVSSGSIQCVPCSYEPSGDAIEIKLRARPTPPVAYLVFEDWAEAMMTLGRNLTVAAALCWAFELGWVDGNDGCGAPGEWWPGCGNPAP